MALDPETKLVWLGVKQSVATESAITQHINQLKETIGEWEDFQSAVEGDGSYSDFSTTLQNNGWDEEDATAFIDTLKRDYTDWADFANDVGAKETYEEWSTGFGSVTGMSGTLTTDDGKSAAGIRIHESPTVSESGVQLPAGTVEVFAQRIEFSSTAPPRPPDQPITVSNFECTDPDNTIEIFVEMFFEADINNPNDHSVQVTVPLIEDGSVIQQQTLRIAQNGTKRVRFGVTKFETFCGDYAISKSDTVLACWVHTGLNP